MVIDVITYNGEAELFEIRYNILKDHVNEFIVVEFDKTFSGKPKESTFKYQDWPKVKYCFVTEDTWSKYLEMARESPNTQGAEHWKTEFAQKESIKDCLTHLNNDDTVFIGDCDEIWDPFWVRMWKTGKTAKLKLKVYTYYLNNRSSEEFWGPIVTQYEQIKDFCLNHIRSIDINNDWKNKESHWKTPGEYGWHFTSLKDNLRKKLEDSYTSDSYASPPVMDNLEENIKQNKDFLGRDFKYTIDESHWPGYLVINREKYLHLLK